MKQLKVANGVVINDENKPFFLPGANITIRCMRGYGVKKEGYVTEYQLSCKDNIAVKKCSMIPSERGSCELYQVLVVVLVIALLFLLSFSLVYGHSMMKELKILKNKGQFHDQSTMYGRTIRSISTTVNEFDRKSTFGSKTLGARNEDSSPENVLG
jgi:hypothetical protein